MTDGNPRGILCTMSTMTTTTPTTDTSARLPEGYTMRPPVLADLVPVVALLAACEIHDYGETEEAEATLQDHWQPMALQDEARIVLDAKDCIVGYGDQAERNPVRLPGYGCVHPDQRGRGIGTALTAWVESRAEQRIQDAPEGSKVRLQFGMAPQNQGAIDLLEERGYALERSFQRMVIELGKPPPPPQWPARVQVRVYQRGPDDRATWQAVEEAFDDHWGNVRSSFEEWSKIYARQTFDPSLWFLAIERDEIAGASLCSTREQMGWVGSLSVGRPWRRRGLAAALLNHTFGEFYRRGQRKVGLGVDSSSLTGATRVYERAGMHADRHTIGYARVLRDGEEISTDSLD